METIAISYLKVQSQMVTNLRVAHQRNPIAFNRDLLTTWKCMNPRTDQVQVSPLLLNLTEMKVSEALCIDRLIPVRLEKCSVSKNVLYRTSAHNLKV